MKFWILIFSAALFVGGTCLGVALQPRISPAAKPEPKIDPAPQPSWGHHDRGFSVHRFASELDLSSEQDRELDAILSDSHDEMQALGRAMRSAQDRSRERIVGILSPEQKSKFDALLAAERQKRSASETKRTVDAYQKILGLNDEQAAAMNGILTEARNRRREAFKPGGDFHTARKASRDEQTKALEKVLNAEQYQRYRDVSELERYDR